MVASNVAWVIVLVTLQALLITILLFERARRKVASASLDAAAKVFSTTGSVFFQTLTEHLNSVLQVDYVSIGELSNDGSSIKTVAVSAGGKNLENLEYPLEHTPCQKVLEFGRYFDPAGIQAHFPLDAFLVEMGFQAYLGVALTDSAGQRLGVMSVLSKQPLKDTRIAELTLSLFAARCSVEMERRRSELALRTSEDRNRAILKGIPDAMYVLDRRGMILDYSASVQNELYGSPEDVLGKSIRDLLPPDAAEAIERAIQQTMNSAETSSVEVSVPVGNDVSFYDARVVLLAVDKVLVIVRNVSGQKKAELELEKSNDFFQKVATTMPGVLFVYDLVQRRNVYVNQGGWGVLGYSDEEVLEMGDTFLARIMHPDDLASLPKLGEEYARASEGAVFENQFRMRHKNGEWRWVHRLATIFTRTPEGRPQQLVGTATDITDLKRAEEELRRLSTRLLDAQDQERRRIARELHDGTAQNIFAIRLNLAQLDRQGVPGAARILSECENLCDKSLQEIRTLSYLLHPPMLDQGGLIPAVRWFVEGFATRSSLNVKLEVPSAMERLPAALERDLFLVVQEALSNVVRHSGSDTAVVRLDHQTNEVTLQVQDFGRGMPGIAKDGNDQAYDGVGIPSMRERLRHISGRLEIQSTNQGTTVIAKVPLNPDDSATLPN